MLNGTLINAVPVESNGYVFRKSIEKHLKPQVIIVIIIGSQMYSFPIGLLHINPAELNPHREKPFANIRLRRMDFKQLVEAFSHIPRNHVSFDILVDCDRFISSSTGL